MAIAADRHSPLKLWPLLSFIGTIRALGTRPPAGNLPAAQFGARRSPDRLTFSRATGFTAQRTFFSSFISTNNDNNVDNHLQNSYLHSLNLYRRQLVTPALRPSVFFFLLTIAWPNYDERRRRRRTSVAQPVVAAAAKVRLLPVASFLSDWQMDGRAERLSNWSSSWQRVFRLRALCSPAKRKPTCR